MTTALLLVDVQRNMLEPPTPVPDAPAIRAAIEGLLSSARASGAVIVHIQNDGGAGDPDEPGTEGWELVLVPDDGEIVVRKDESDTFAANPTLGAQLADRGVDRLVVAGMQSNYCVAATSRGALLRDFDVTLASGAHATYDEDRPASVISRDIEASLADEGVRILPAGEVTFS